jgi:hypothetical protein
VHSLDECDTCNHTFSPYEGALAASVGPFLTLGGVKGKRNKVRQTGRTGGPVYVKDTNEENQRGVLAIARDADPELTFDSTTRNIGLRVPLAEEKFRPRHAYKALSKMGFSLLPTHELSNYTRLRSWLLENDDDVSSPALKVAFSFAMVGYWPEIVTGTLLRRVDANDSVPHVLFVFTAGSVCFQIGLLSDNKDDHVSSAGGAPHVEWVTKYRDIKVQYSDSVQFDWSSTASEPQPLEAFTLALNLTNSVGKFEPIFRTASLLP